MIKSITVHTFPYLMPEFMATGLVSFQHSTVLPLFAFTRAKRLRVSALADLMTTVMHWYLCMKISVTHNFINCKHEEDIAQTDS